MKANSDKSKQSNKATRRVLAGVLCGASVLSLVLSLVMPPISQAIANDVQTVSTEETVMGGGSSSESTDVENTNNGDTENQNSDETEGDETGDDALRTAPLPDDTGAESVAQPADEDANGEDSTALTGENTSGYIEIKGNVTDQFASGGNYLLVGDAWSEKPIEINNDTAIDLAGHKLYYLDGGNDTFITVKSGALTIKDSGKVDSGKPLDETTPVNENNPGQLAEMKWTSDNNGTTPQSLTYYETTSTPSEDKLGTTETTTKHVVSGFGAIVAASKSGSVKQVISVADGSTLNLNGGMITTPRALGNDGHVIFSQGAVNISGGYVTNGNGGGWGGGLCVTGADASLVMTGGVIAGNKAASGGGIYADKGATLKLSGGVISGNATYAKDINDGNDVGLGGYGGGVYTQGAYVTISDSVNITNNRAEARIANGYFYNKGFLGGGGIASMNGGTLSMTGGSVTANYSYEAGGGIYAGRYGQGVEFAMSSGFIAGNKSDNAEGGGLRISGGTTGVINAENASNRVYITNNKTMTGSIVGRGGDWGGGGVFVQEGGTLNIVKTLITNNNAGGWGGGIGACPTGQTIVSHSKGAAIYNNTDNIDQDGTHLETPHYSAGGNGKTEDSNPDYIGDPFKNHGHKDFFLVRKDDSHNTVAVVLGKMLGGESAGWQGTCDRHTVTIDPNGGAEAKYMFGLEAHPTNDAIAKAQAAATTIISGNYSYTHGGGIMTNGDLVVGEVNDLRVYPSMKLNATKALVDAKGNKQSLNGHAYKFQLLRQEVNGIKAPSWKDDGTFDMGDCSVAGEAAVEPDGSVTFDSGKDYSSGQYVFYLVEEPISGQNELDTKFDKKIYKIEATVEDDSSHSKTLMGFKINYYKVQTVAVYKKAEDDKDFVPLDPGDYSVGYSEDNTKATVAIGKNGNPTFTNKIEPYTSNGSWTPKATKVVEGGEMKEFTLEFADNPDFKDAQAVKTEANDHTTQPLEFPKIWYDLDSLKQNDADVPGRAASKTFTYYVREMDEHSTYPHYKFDPSVYRFKVVATDNTEGGIDCAVTYRKGTVNPKGEWTADASTAEETFTDDSTPTFTNTYSTSLPLSGMSGVTLTYLAGAAVLCAAAAWMHIRRKANAKGGERRE